MILRLFEKITLLGPDPLVEIEQTQQMLQEAQKAHDKAIAVSYEQLRNLLSGKAQSQWDRICCEMHERDSWAAVNGQVTKGWCPQTWTSLDRVCHEMHERDSWAAVNSQVNKDRHPRMWTSFLDCLELHKLPVFSADRQRFYIQQVVRKPQRATVQQQILRMGVLNVYVKHLPMLKDSSKAVPTMKKGNIPFGKADLAAIVLSSVLMSWQNQYNLNHSMVPKSTRTLLPDLEAIEQVMVEKKGANLKTKGKDSTAPSEAKGNPKCKASRGPTGQSLRRVAVRSFANGARLMADSSQCTTPWTAVAMTAMVSPLRQQQVSPLSPRSPTRSLGAKRAWPSCSPCSRLM